MSARLLLICAPLVLMACCATPGKPPIGNGSGSVAPPFESDRPPPSPRPATLGKDLHAERVAPLDATPQKGGRPAALVSNQRYQPAHRLRLDAFFPRMAVSPAGDTIAVAAGVQDDVYIIRDPARPDQDLALHLGMHPEESARPGSLWRGYAAQRTTWCLAPSPMLVVASTRAIWAIDPATWATLPGFPLLLTGTKYISAVECLPDGAIAVGEGAGGPDGHGNLTVLERSGKLRLSVRVHRFYPTALAVLPDGSVATQTPTGFGVWSAVTGKQIAARTVAHRGQHTFEVDGALVASPVANELAVVIHDFGRKYPFLASAPAFEVQPIPALQALIAGDLARNQLSPPLDYELAIGTTRALAYSPDGRTLVIAGQEDEHVWAGDSWDRNVLWVVHDGKLVDTLVGHSGYIQDVAVLGDGRIVSLDDNNGYGKCDLIVWEPRP